MAFHFFVPFVMLKKFRLQTVIPASPTEVYKAWLNSESHAEMTGGSPAIVNDEVGKPFAAHNAYLWGKNLVLEPYSKIIQSWRTSGFKSTDEDSEIEINFENHEKGTLLTLTHSKVPEQEAHVEQGWVSHYFEPMIAYFTDK